MQQKQNKQPNSDVLEMLETPWLRRQVETHFVFGILPKYFPFLFSSSYIQGASDYQNRALQFVVIKVSGFAISFLFLMGSVINFLKKDPDASALLILGIAWMPSLEFVPQITPHQKYITIARATVTFIVWYIWIRV